jgi:hypothetical protein
MGKPHRGRKPFASNITDCEYEIAIQLQQADEIAREMTHRKDLACDVIRTCSKITRTTEFSLHMSGFVHRPAKILVLML